MTRSEAIEKAARDLLGIDPSAPKWRERDALQAALLLPTTPSDATPPGGSEREPKRSLLPAYEWAEQCAMERDGKDDVAADAFRELCDPLWYALTDAERETLRTRTGFRRVTPDTKAEARWVALANVARPVLNAWKNDMPACERVPLLDALACALADPDATAAAFVERTRKQALADWRESVGDVVAAAREEGRRAGVEAERERAAKVCEAAGRLQSEAADVSRSQMLHDLSAAHEKTCDALYRAAADIRAATDPAQPAPIAAGGESWSEATVEHATRGLRWGLVVATHAHFKSWTCRLWLGRDETPGGLVFSTRLEADPARMQQLVDAANDGLRSVRERRVR